MHTRTLWPALLLVAAAACSEGGSPVDTPWERSFNIAVPALRQLTSSTSAVAPQPTDSVAAASSYNMEDLPPGYAEVLSAGLLITEASTADAGFHGDYSAAFGQALGRSRGSYYRNTATLKLRYQGTEVAQNVGEKFESCLCSHFWSPWGDIASVTIPVEGACGHLATVNSRHDAKLQLWFPGGMLTLLSQEDTDSAFASQPSCGGGSSGGGGDDGEWYICSWEDWYTDDGTFMHRVELGCMLYHGHVS